MSVSGRALRGFFLRGASTPARSAPLDRGGHDTYPRLFSIRNARRKATKDHGPNAYSNRFSCVALMLGAGAGPGRAEQSAVRARAQARSQTRQYQRDGPYLRRVAVPQKLHLDPPGASPKSKTRDRALDEPSPNHHLSQPDGLARWTTPNRPILGQTGSHRIQADVRNCGQQMQVVHGDRSKPSLKRVTGPSPSRVNEIGVAPMRFSDGQPETIRSGRTENEVDITPSPVALLPDWR